MSKIFYYDSSDVGAPSLTNAAGTLLTVLRDCGINGFGAKSVSSIVVAGNVATATASAHGYPATTGKLLLLAGSGEAGLNGVVQPLSVTSNTFTYAAPGVADGTYTGTLTAKRAPFGLTELFTGTNTAMFSFAAPEASDIKLRVNDSLADGSTVYDARVFLVETATGIDTYSDLCPTTAQRSGGLYWPRGDNNATAKQWAIVADDQFCWFICAATFTAAGALDVRNFGRPVRLFSPDAYMNIITGGIAVSNSSGANSNGALAADISSSSATNRYVQRASTGVGSAIAIQQNGFPSAAVEALSVTGKPIAISRAMWLRDASGQVRGRPPGLVQPLAQSSTLTSMSVYPDVGGSGRDYLFVVGWSGGRTGVMLDLTGPWR